MNKLTLQALALTGILAVSGLPALAADMAPASPAPSASVSTDSKAKVGTSVDTKAKTSIDKNAVDKNVDKSKSADKNVDKSSKIVSKDKKKVEQTAAKPVPHTSASTSTSVGADHAGANASSGATVQH